MTPKEKAEELVNKYDEYAFIEWDEKFGFDHTTLKKNAIQCALLAVEEILNENHIDEGSHTRYKFWQEVKQELEKL